MAGAATLSATFAFHFNPSNTSATVLTNPGLDFRVVGIAASNPTGGAVNVTVDDGTSNITNGGAYSAAANTTSWADLDEANADIASGTNLRVTCADTSVNVTIYCMAKNGGVAVTAT